MMPLDRAARADGARIRAALAVRLRDLDRAEEAFAESCARAARSWPRDGVPDNPAGWLYRVAIRVAIDQMRRSPLDAAEPAAPAAEPDPWAIPDERLRLIFLSCHPALAPDARVALTLRIVCGLSTEAIAAMFLQPVATVAQRIVRAKRKIATSNIAFELPPRGEWDERADAVLATIEVAYARVHADAAGTGPHADPGGEMVTLATLAAELLPHNADAHALAATLCFAEARRPARIDAAGRMVPLDQQDPALWDKARIARGRLHLGRALAARSGSRRILLALTHAEWCARVSLDDPPPWPALLTLYDAMLATADDPVVRLNRAVALAHVQGAEAALAEIDTLDVPDDWQPLHAVRADLLARLGRAATRAPGTAERLWLTARRDALTPSSDA